jgi:hypothetical protein
VRIILFADILMIFIVLIPIPFLPIHEEGLIPRDSSAHGALADLPRTRRGDYHTMGMEVHAHVSRVGERGLQLTD